MLKTERHSHIRSEPMTDNTALNPCDAAVRSRLLQAERCFLLDGVIETADEIPFDLVLADLGSGEAIDVGLAFDDAGNPPRLSLGVAAATEEAAATLADRLALVAAVGPYAFRAVPRRDLGPYPPHRREIEPVGLLLPASLAKRPSNLRRLTPSGSSIVLPAVRHLEGGFALGGVLPLLDQVPDGIQLTLRIERFVTSARERRWMSEASALLASWEGEFDCPTTTGSVVLIDAVRRDLLVSAVATWRRAGQGLRVTLALAGKSPPGDGLVSLVGSAFFARPVHTATTPYPMNEESLDLRCALPAAIALGRLLPAAGDLRRVRSPRVFLDAAIQLPTRGVVLGHLAAGGQREVRLSHADRSRHVHILGATGAGKSTLLLSMLMQDIARGDGACLIDPHGDMFEQALAMMPSGRLDDVVVIDPGDVTHAVGLNLLEADPSAGAAARNFAINEMIAIFSRLYDMRVVGGPMFEMYMRNAMLLLLEGGLPDATLIDVPRVFQDRVLRNAMLARCTNRLVINFWQREALRATGDASLEAIAPYVTSKLNQFIGNALLRPIIGQPRSTIDFRRFMDEGKVVLVNLARGLCGDLDSRLLGMVTVGKIFASALGRVRMPEESRRPFNLYIDECQNLLTPTMAQMLAEARKFGLRLVLANQTLGQLEDGNSGMLTSMLGNVGSLLLMRLGPIDAERMEIFTRPYLSATELRTLPDREVAACLLVEGRPIRPFVFRSRAWPGLADPAVAEEARELSRRRYAAQVSSIEAEIALRLLPLQSPAASGDPAPVTVRTGS